MVACKRTTWWWAALLANVGVLALIAVSFRCIPGWSNYRVYVYLEHGLLCANPSPPPPGTTPGTLPWYGLPHVIRSPVYTPWAFWPEFRHFGPGAWVVRIPLHLAFFVLLPVVIFPVLPPVVRYRRRRRGLCIHCEYDLTGNISGVCPECGHRIDAE